jgi:hypothetical protein
MGLTSRNYAAYFCRQPENKHASVREEGGHAVYVVGLIIAN